MAIEIRLAESTFEREAVYRMRYQVNVLEMGRKQAFANHENQTIRDPLDDTGLVVAAFDGSTIVGTQRINLGMNSVFGDYENYYQMKQFEGFHPAQTSISTRLMVLPSHRGTTVPIKLANACYKIGLDAGVRFDFMHCNDHLVKYFQHLGFRQVFERFEHFEHPEYGAVNPMVLSSLDFAHLTACRSPFRKFTPVSEREDASVGFLKKLIKKTAEERSRFALEENCQ